MMYWQVHGVWLGWGHCATAVVQHRCSVVNIHRYEVLPNTSYRVDVDTRIYGCVVTMLMWDGYMPAGMYLHPHIKHVHHGPVMRV